MDREPTCARILPSPLPNPAGSSERIQEALLDSSRTGCPAANPVGRPSTAARFCCNGKVSGPPCAWPKETHRLSPPTQGRPRSWADPPGATSASSVQKARTTPSSGNRLEWPPVVRGCGTSRASSPQAQHGSPEEQAGAQAHQPDGMPDPTRPIRSSRHVRLGLRGPDPARGAALGLKRLPNVRWTSGTSPWPPVA